MRAVDLCGLGIHREIVEPAFRPAPRLAWALLTLTGAALGVILAGKRLLITGVITKESIAFHAAEQAQQEGATVLLTSFGRVRRMTERAAKRLPEPAEVLELDVNKPSELSALTERTAGKVGRSRRRPARDRLRAGGRARRTIHDRSRGERDRRPSRRAPSRSRP